MTIDEQGRPEPPLAADEADTLVGFLEFQRATLAWKSEGLDAAGMKATVGVSTMTIGGMLKHMAFVEDYWFSHWLHDRAPMPPWDAVDWKATPDWEWESAAHDTRDELRAVWQSAVERSRGALEQTLADGGLGQLAKRTWPSGDTTNVRWILCHMIEEYARHNGHADLIRESVDGVVGE